MARTVFVLVEGFSPSERRALESMMQLSRERSTVYWHWREGAARAPSLLLVDGGSQAAVQAARSHLQRLPELMTIWVLDERSFKDQIPASVVEVLTRPMDWQRLRQMADFMFAPAADADGALDFDLDHLAALPTQPEVLESPDLTLLVHLLQEIGLLARAWLAARGFCLLDHVVDLAESKAALAEHAYAAVLVGDHLPFESVWSIVDAARNNMAAAFVLSDAPSLQLRAQACRHGVGAVLSPPMNFGAVVKALRAARA